MLDEWVDGEEALGIKKLKRKRRKRIDDFKIGRRDICPSNEDVCVCMMYHVSFTYKKKEVKEIQKKIYSKEEAKGEAAFRI